MTTTLTEHADEKSTYKIKTVFTDDDEQLVIPETITWTLMDTAGTTINSRLDVSVTTPASTIYIALYGDDLAIQTTESHRKTVRRIVLVEGTYNSTLGNDLPLKDVCIFKIDNHTGVT